MKQMIIRSNENLEQFSSKRIEIKKSGWNEYKISINIKLPNCCYENFLYNFIKRNLKRIGRPLVCVHGNASCPYGYYTKFIKKKMINPYKEWLVESLEGGADSFTVCSGEAEVQEEINSYLKENGFEEADFETIYEWESETDIAEISEEYGYEYIESGIYSNISNYVRIKE